VLSGLPAGRNIDFGHDIFPKLLAAGQTIIGYPISDALIDIGTPEKYQKAQHLAGRLGRAYEKYPIELS
jgi:NDP-sugar pyrophosphorylase family protein